ncbi:hypothetical protein [[Pseudopropionibacterium] massiliense]|uniref:hypothetical protein n=1 Tax=[Pseudopropionibacterium] massiliense TaxID=2220000 RepID=UPI001030855E|nr:hypothetical protein [[Pseudopropionibacterium] massiliense]
MSLTRRHLFAGLGALTLTACAPGPVVDELPVPPPKPTQDPGVSTLSSAVTKLSGVLSEQPDPWRTAALAQTSAWQARLLAADPLIGGEPVFPETSASPSAPQNSDPAAASTDATQLVLDAATKALEEAPNQPMRLFHVSILLATTGLRNPASVPDETVSEPYRYAETTDKAALGAALTHVWALLQALEKGLGITTPKDPLHATLQGRHTELKRLRDRLISALGSDRPRQDGHYDLPAITDVASFQTTELELESKLLNGLAGVVAAAGEKDWLGEALAQVPRLQALGGRLPAWPGWVNS